MIVYEAMTQVSNRPNNSYTSGVGTGGAKGAAGSPMIQPGGPGSPNNQALYYSIKIIILYQKTNSLDLKENVQEFIQTNEKRQAFFGKYN